MASAREWSGDLFRFNYFLTVLRDTPRWFRIFSFTSSCMHYLQVPTFAQRVQASIMTDSSDTGRCVGMTDSQLCQTCHFWETSPQTLQLYLAPGSVALDAQKGCCSCRLLWAGRKYATQDVRGHRGYRLYSERNHENYYWKVTPIEAAMGGDRSFQIFTQTVFG
jgi:hypothetical protein